MRKNLILAALCTATACAAMAQTQTQTQAPALGATATPAVSSPAKKELVSKLLELQRPAIESWGRALAEQPAGQVMQAAGAALQQRIAPDRREVLAREIEADVRKYVDETVPIVRDMAVKLAPSTMGVVVEQSMDEAELRQLLAVLENPAFKKFQAVFGDAQRSLLTKLTTESRPAMEVKARALDAAVGKRLGITPAPTPSPASTGAAQPTTPAPAVKK